MYLNGPDLRSVSRGHVIPQGDVSPDPLPSWPISGVGPGQRVYPLPSQVGPMAGGGPPLSVSASLSHRGKRYPDNVGIQV